MAGSTASPTVRRRQQCPKCGSKKLWRDGLRYLKTGVTQQRWLCRNCGFRFTNSNNRNASRLLEGIQTKKIKTHLTTPHRRVGARKEAKNLAAREKFSVLAGESLADDARGKLLEYAWWMKKQGYAESTITGRVKLLKILVKRGANLFDEESIKEVIAKQQWSAGRKANAVEAYTCFLRMLGRTWTPPIYKRIKKLPFIPTEEEIDQLIAGCGQKTACFLQILKETAARAGEAWNLKWTDIDFVNRTIRITPEKGSNPRIFKVSTKLIGMLNTLPRNSERLFGNYHHRGFSRTFQRQRKKLAVKLGNPRLQQISFHTFRHWKATMEYHRTKDILYVMKFLGHKNIKNTLIYTQLVDFGDEEYICKAAQTVEEAKKLIEAGFEYVCTTESYQLFRKRK